MRLDAPLYFWRDHTGNEIDLSASYLSIEHSLPMADSIILATARKHRATLYTRYADFKGLDNVVYH